MGTTLPFKDPLVMGVLAVIGIAGSAFAAYGACVVLGWVYSIPAVKHTRFAPGEQLLPLRGRWLGCAFRALVTLVAAPLLLLAVFLCVACLVWLATLLFNAH